MKLTTKELNIYYAKLYLEAFTSEDMEEDLTASEQFQHTYDRFYAEYGWRIKHVGKLVAFTEWLQGLALAIPYMNNEILDMAKETGHLVSSPRTQNNEYKILDNYWNFMTCKFFWLLDRKQTWFDTNLKQEEK